MNPLPARLFAAVLLLLASACGTRTADVRVPVRLADLVSSASTAAAGVELRLQALDADGAPVRHAIVHLALPDGGRLAFQADVQGVLWLRVPDARTPFDAMVEVRAVREGEDLLARDYDEFALAVAGARLVVDATPYTPRGEPNLEAAH